MGVYYALILLVLVLSAVTAYTGRVNYLSIVNVSNVLYQSSLIAIMAVAMMVILITGNFNLSVASVAALSAAVMIGLTDSIGFVPAALVAMLVAVLADVLNDRTTAWHQRVHPHAGHADGDSRHRADRDGRALAVRRERRCDHRDARVRIRPRAARAFLRVAGRRADRRERAAVDARETFRRHARFQSARRARHAARRRVRALGWFSGARLVVAKPVVYMAVFTGIVWFVLTFTNTGRRLYAVGGNAEAARLSGINVGRYKIEMAGFILCSAAASFGGILFGSRLGAINPTALQGAELMVIASAIFGGTSLTAARAASSRRWSARCCCSR